MHTRMPACTHSHIQERERERECGMPTIIHIHTCTAATGHFPATWHARTTTTHSWTHMNIHNLTAVHSLQVSWFICWFTYLSHSNQMQEILGAACFCLFWPCHLKLAPIFWCYAQTWVSNLGRKSTSSPSISKCNRPSCVKISIYQSDWAYMSVYMSVFVCTSQSVCMCVWVGGAWGEFGVIWDWVYSPPVTTQSYLLHMYVVLGFAVVRLLSLQIVQLKMHLCKAYLTK